MNNKLFAVLALTLLAAFNSRLTTSRAQGTASIIISLPTNGPTYLTAASSINLGGTTSGGNGGVAWVKWGNSLGGSFGWATGTTAWSVASIPLQHGTNVITVTAWDTVAAQSTATLTIICTAPTPQIIANFTTLHNFMSGTNDGSEPECVLAQGSDGAFYGTSFVGGQSYMSQGNQGYGTIYKINLDGSGFNLLHSFIAVTNGGPYGGLLQVGNGLMYGTTVAGTGNNGTVFSLNTNGGAFTTLLDVAAASQSANKLIRGTDGLLYGVGVEGAAGNYGSLPFGAIFKANTNGSNFSVLYGLNYFTNDADWFLNHFESVIQGQDGLLYGVAACGGTNNISEGGGVFRLATDGADFTVLHMFDSGAEGLPLTMQLGVGEIPGDGFGPLGTLLQGPDGMLYGTTEFGGTGSTGTIPGNSGTVFKINTNGSSYMVLHSFVGGTNDGGAPYGGLVLGTDGVLYGTTELGGLKNAGTIFRLNLDGSGYALIHSFTGLDGSWPEAGLMEASSGVFCGTTDAGGSTASAQLVGTGYGTIFKFTVGTGPAFTGIQAGHTGVLLSFLGSPGQTYQIQAATSLQAPSWQTITTNVAGTDGSFQFLDTNAPMHASHFYRAVQ